MTGDIGDIDVDVGTSLAENIKRRDMDRIFVSCRDWYLGWMDYRIPFGTLDPSQSLRLSRHTLKSENLQ